MAPARRLLASAGTLQGRQCQFPLCEASEIPLCGIELCGRPRSPALLTHGQPSGLKRSKSAFLLVRHRPADEYFRGLIESERFI
jgi:hypothetical protein